jgi:hypothetical protein
MSDSSSREEYVWSANDWSNIVTISSAALASVLLVVFKSRCTQISLFWGLWKCDRKVPEDVDPEDEAVVPAPPARSVSA